MEKAKNNTWLIILLILVILGLAGFIVYDKVLSREEVPSEEKTTNNADNDKILQNILGDYGKCDGAVCGGIEITKDENNEYHYHFYQANAGGFRIATITEVKNISDDKYELTGYYEATNGNSIYGENPEKTEKITIDLSKITKTILIVNEKEYQKITTTRDEFYALKEDEGFKEINQMLGDWGRCNENECGGIEIEEKENKIYNYRFYQPNAGGFRTASVNILPQKISDNKYELTGYYPATNGNSIYGENPAKEEKITIDFSKISENILIVNEKEYQKITTTRDEFYNSKIN